MINRIELPKHVNHIIHRLQEHGFDAYAVGGCVRDTLLGRVPKDWDITTSATPERVKQLFSHTIDTGIEHGTVTVMLEHVGYEVTTYRIDGEYEDGRHPKEVTFTDNLKEDLRRRDFTINAMAYNDERGLVDVFDGVGDLEHHVIRCVGDARERFTEDALRMLRAVRFAAQLDFSIEEETKEAVRLLAPTIAKVSAERIQMELVKLLCSGKPALLETAYDLGLTAVFLPEFDRMMQTPQHNKHHCYSVGQHTLMTLSSVKADKVLRLTMLLHDVAKPQCLSTDEAGQNHFYEHPQIGAEIAGKVLRRLKFDNATIRQTCRLILFHDERPALSEKSVRRLASKIGEEYVLPLLEVKRADVVGQSEYKKEEKLAYIDEFAEVFKRLQEQNQCMKKADLAINGRDLMELGVPQGKEIGRILDALFNMVLEHPRWNTREKLIELSHNLISPFI